ncbi:sulfatase-modifying factor protein [Ahniella affigens]|uniref:Sulfatase-modifying factor protein n=1 Tax=Ahniella affigens TaxID=2021234 RepID=A0A2P1PVZ0_9GAMM|nr:formylglycine-generating enzyme family protein [Ahniella affigens]AVP98944.1 sulfatase-modifying factor protein [Ahniella affigens]
MSESRQGDKMSRKQVWGSTLGLGMLAIAMAWRWIWPSLSQIDWSKPDTPNPVEARIQALAEQAHAAPAEDEPDAAPVEADAMATIEDMPAAELDAEAAAKRDELLEQAKQATTAKHWLQPENGNALSLYTQALLLDPANSQARIGLEALLDSLFNEAGNALDEGDDALALDLVAALDRYELTDKRLPALARRVSVLPAIADALTEAAERFAAGHLLDPDGASALDSYRAVLSLDPRNRAGKRGLDDLAATLLNQALAAASSESFAEAFGLLNEATAVAPGNPRLKEVQDKVTNFRDRFADDLLARAELALKARERSRAEALLEEARALGLSDDRLANVARQLNNAQLYGNYQPGETFSDNFLDRSATSPTMVVIPIGTFSMGSDEQEPGRHGNEGPRHLVRIEQPFALARTETTVSQFRKFVNATKYVTDAEKVGEASQYDEKTGRITRQRDINWRNDYLGGRAKTSDPVLYVSWNDAMAFAEWLSRSTGQRYRLPSEAEFEYALRAGTESPYWWGEGSPQTVVGNLTGEGDRSRSRRTWTKAFDNYRDGYWGPAPVAQFAANPFGLYDLGSNLSEWVEDCWHDNFLRAPDTGAAWVNRGCTGRTIKGGSWGSAPEDVRSAYRLGVSADTRTARIGFRVARDLSQ